MATFTATPVADGYTGRNDPYSGRGSSTWAEVVTETLGETSNTTGTLLYMTNTKRTMGAVWLINRPKMYFDLSSMPADATITSAKITFYVNTHSTNDAAGHIMRLDYWDESPTISVSDYDGYDVNYKTSDKLNFTGTGSNDFLIDSTLLEWLQDNPQGDGSNNFPVMLRGYLDYNGAVSSPTGTNSISIRSVDHSTSAHRPTLEITYHQRAAVNGVANANIAAVNGVTKQDGTKVNSV